MKTKERLAAGRKARHAARRKQAQIDRRVAHLRHKAKVEEQAALVSFKQAIDALGTGEN